MESHRQDALPYCWEGLSVLSTYSSGGWKGGWLLWSGLAPSSIARLDHGDGSHTKNVHVRRVDLSRAGSNVSRAWAGSSVSIKLISQNTPS
jgi:hypothetical protein